MSQISTFFAETLPYYWSPVSLVAFKPTHNWYFRWEYVGLLGLLALVGLVTAFLKIRPSLKSRIQALCWTNVALGVFLYFARDQRIPYIGMDLWRFIQEIGLVFWINSIVLFSRGGLKQELVAERVEERRKKYLPK